MDTCLFKSCTCQLQTIVLKTCIQLLHWNKLFLAEKRCYDFWKNYGVTQKYWQTECKCYNKSVPLFPSLLQYICERWRRMYCKGKLSCDQTTYTNSPPGGYDKFQHVIFPKYLLVTEYVNLQIYMCTVLPKLSTCTKFLSVFYFQSHVTFMSDNKVFCFQIFKTNLSYTHVHSFQC